MKKAPKMKRSKIQGKCDGCNMRVPARMQTSLKLGIILHGDTLYHAKLAAGMIGFIPNTETSVFTAEVCGRILLAFRAEEPAQTPAA